jgi:hypothetical protein
MLHDDLLDELERYHRLTGLAVSTICVRAINDSRFVARHQRRLRNIAKDAYRIRKYMAENPPIEEEDAA